MENFTIKGPSAVLVLIVLAASLALNVVKLAQGPQIIPMRVEVGGSGASATLPNGQPDPLQHIPSNPRDAVGMPDGTGGRATATGAPGIPGMPPR